MKTGAHSLNEEFSCFVLKFSFVFFLCFCIICFLNNFVSHIGFCVLILISNIKFLVFYYYLIILILSRIALLLAIRSVPAPKAPLFALHMILLCHINRPTADVLRACPTYRPPPAYRILSRFPYRAVRCTSVSCQMNKTPYHPHRFVSVPSSIHPSFLASPVLLAPLSSLFYKLTNLAK